jgi:hypothetical protein
VAGDAVEFSTQLVVTTHSPHIIYESGFRPIRYFRRSRKAEKGHTSRVLNLSNFYGKTKEDTRDFLQRYMKFTHCDLFFADAAVLVEGNVERLLLPLMIEKAASGLRSRYLSILEVGGAYAHRFKELLEFLGQPALVITDLDSVAVVTDGGVGVQADPGTQEEEESPEGSIGSACMVGAPDAETSNQTLIQWLPKLKLIVDLLNANSTAKTQIADGTSPATIRVTYQTAREVKWNGEKAMLAGRTLEEDFALENLEWCQHIDRKDLHLKVVPESRVMTLAEIAKKLFKRVKAGSFKKTDFALGLMTQKPEGWKVPVYIQEGLLWLDKEVARSDEKMANTAAQGTATPS